MGASSLSAARGKPPRSAPLRYATHPQPRSYSNISSGFEHEWGLDYARLFLPANQSFVRVAHRLPLGRTWYPTAQLLPDGRVLVTGGFSDYGTARCVGDTCALRQLLSRSCSADYPRRHESADQRL